MNPKEWNTYLDTGTVPTYFIQEIVQLIKNNQALSTKHLAVYQSQSPLIELHLKIQPEIGKNTTQYSLIKSDVPVPLKPPKFNHIITQLAARQ